MGRSGYQVQISTRELSNQYGPLKGALWRVCGIIAKPWARMIMMVWKMPHSWQDLEFPMMPQSGHGSNSAVGMEAWALQCSQ